MTDTRVIPCPIDESDFYELESRREQMEFLLRYAVLAPSSRNTQPWKFQITSDEVEVFADYTRRLPVIDPDDRELLMSVGAAIANFRVAAAHFGFMTTMRYDADPKPGDPVAFITISETSWPDRTLASLFRAIPKRHTNRGTFDGQPIGLRSLSRIEALMDTYPETLRIVLPDDKLHAEQLIEYAGHLQMDLPAVRAELAQWIRPADGPHTDGMPGRAFGVPRLLAAGASWLLAAGPSSLVERLGAGSWHGARQRSLAESAPVLLIVNAHDQRASLLRAGEILEQLLLTITDAGLQYSFLNQAIEVDALRARVQMLSGSTAPPQLLLRIGSAPPVDHALPRRPVGSVITPAGAS